MTTLVTGGTGFVGGAIVRELVRRGEQVQVLARSTSKTEHLRALGVEIARGDILDKDSLVAALRGCRRLYHAAAIYEFWTPDPELVLRTEIDGTRNMMEAALAAGVEKVIYTSTAATVGEPKGVVGDENTPHRGYFLSTYDRAKTLAERVAKTYLERGLPLVIVKPAAVIGPGDRKPTGQTILDLLNGRLPALFRGTLSLVYIDDVAKAHVLAAEKPPGEEYILAERIATTTELFGLACEMAGVRRPPVLPVFAARLYARWQELKARLTGRRPLLPRQTVAFTAHGFRVTGAKAARELGLTYTPLEEGLRRAIQWYWEQGLLRRKPACVA